IGPFDNTSNAGFHEIYPPEKEIDFSKIYPGKDANLTKWHTLKSRAHNGWIFMDNHTTAYNSVFYLYCVINSPSDKSVLLSFGSSSSFKIMLNGHLVLADSIFRNTGIDAFIQKVNLKSGKNPLLIKLGHETGNSLTGNTNKSNFCIRFLTESYNRVNDIDVSLESVNTPVNIKPVSYSNYRPSPITDTIVSVLENRIRKNEEDYDAVFLLLQFYLGMELTDKAEELAFRYIRKNPESALFQTLYSEAMLRAKKHVETQIALKKAYMLSPDNASAWNSELDLVMNSKDPQKISDFIKASPEHLQNTVKSLLGLIASNYQLQKQSEAMDNIKTMESQFKLDYSAISVLAAFYLEQGKTKKLEKLIKNYLKHRRSNTHFYQYLAQVAMKQGKMSRAVKWYKESITYSPNDPNNYYYLANIHFLNKKNKKALDYINESENIVPHSANVLNMKGNILLAMGKKEEAHITFKRVIDFTNGDFNAWSMLRELDKLPGFNSMAPLPSVDSIIKASKDWEHLRYEKGAIVSLVTDVIYYPSKCSSKRTFMVVYLPTQQAIDLWKERSFGYNPNFQTLQINKAISKKADMTEVPADKNRNEVVFKSLEPGDYIVAEWTVKNYYEGTLADKIYGLESFQYNYPTYDNRLRLVAPKQDTIPYQVYGSEVETRFTDYTDYRVTTFFRKPCKRAHDETYVATDFSENRKVTYSNFSSWADIVDWYLGLTQAKQGYTSEVVALADSLFKNTQSDVEKITKVHEYITSNIRYSYVSFRQSGWIPQAARDVVATKIGDCKDMASLGKALLVLGGIPAHLVLVNTTSRYFLEHSYIGPDFNHCILTYQLDGVWRYVDYTDNNMSPYNLPKADQGAQALVIKAGTHELISLPLDKPEARKKLRKVKMELDKDGVLLKTVHTIRTGVYAAYYREMFRFLPEEERIKDMHKILSSTYPDVSLEKLVFGGLDVLSDTVSYEFVYKAKNTVRLSGNIAIFSVNMLDILEPNSYPVEEDRKYPIDMYRAWYDISLFEQEGELSYPGNWRPMELPKPVSLKSEFGSYTLKFKRVGKKITYKRNARFNFNRQIETKDFSDFTDFLKKISKADQSELLFHTD
ncbi:MAG: DUF3857 domain-containing protein, partial [Fibrobacteria bacterium]|nr:DUF3857 domain-containing protein [Fibrobacteria bacterium]